VLPAAPQNLPDAHSQGLPPKVGKRVAHTKHKPSHHSSHGSTHRHSHKTRKTSRRH
jgi:hypothetical protein